MSPVHSSAARDFRVQRHHASPTPAGLFPECPDDLSPKQAAGDLAPVAGQHGCISDHTTTDCPPSSGISGGLLNRPDDSVRNVAVNSSERAQARLVGIARLAASSPAAETRRRSVERPEYFLLPVKSILNHCDSERVPFDWTINPYQSCEFA